MLLGVCRLWGAGFVVQGTRLAVLCLRARVLGGCCGLLGVCGAWVWCGGASCPGPPFLLGGLGGGCAVGFWGGAPWCGLCGVLLVVCWWVLRWVGWL